MSMKTPDWYRRLRALERRIDNQSTDIARLWNWMPQMPEQPGNFIPQLVPGTTAPPSTTTTTSTTSTSTTGTSTTYTTTTAPPMTCRSTWPSTVTMQCSGFSGEYSWMNNSYPAGVNGTFQIPFESCGSLPDDGTNGFGYYQTFRSPPFIGTLRWQLRVEIRTSDYTVVPGWFSYPDAEYDSISIFAYLTGTFSGARYSYPQNIGSSQPFNMTPLYPPSVGNASGLCGRSFSLPVTTGFMFNTDDWYTWPTSITVQFGSTPYP